MGEDSGDGSDEDFVDDPDEDSVDGSDESPEGDPEEGPELRPEEGSEGADDRRPGPAPDGRRSWIVTLVGALALVFTFGTPYAYGVFLGPFSEAYGVPRVFLSTVFSMELFAFYAVAGVVGVFGLRYPSRLLLLGSGAITVLVAPLLYVVESIVGLFVVFALLGTALGTVYVVLASIVPRWFEKRRGLATGVIFAGIGLSLFVLPPAWEIAFDRLGVQRGFLVVTGTSGAIILLSGVVCSRPPWVDRPATTARDVVEWSRELSRKRSFRLLFVGIGLSFGWYYILAAYSIELFTARGLTETGAAFAFGLIGGVSIISRLGSGFVADSIGYRRTFLGSLACTAVGSVLLFGPQLPAMAAAVFFLGLGFGGIATVYVPMLLSIYDPKKDTAIIGLFNVSFGIFGLAAPPLATTLVAVTGTHVSAVALTLVATVLAFVSVAAGTR